MIVHIIRNGQVLEIGGKTDSQRRLVLEQPERCGRISERILQKSLLAKVPETTEKDGELRKLVKDAELGRMVRARSGLFISAAIATALAIAGCDNSVTDDTDSDANIDAQEETDTSEDDAGVPDVEAAEGSDEGDVPVETAEDGVVDEGSEGDAEISEGSEAEDDSGDAEAEVPGCTETVRAEAAAPLEGPETICGQNQVTTVTDTVTENVGPGCETPGEVNRVMGIWNVDIGPGASLDPAGLVCARGADTRTPEGLRAIVTLAADRLDTAVSLGKSGTLYMGDNFTVGPGEPYIFLDEVGPQYATVNEYSAGPPVTFRVYFDGTYAPPELPGYIGYVDVPRFTGRGLIAILESSFSIRLVLIDTSTFLQESGGGIRPIGGRDYEWNQWRDALGGVQRWGWVLSTP